MNLHVLKTFAVVLLLALAVGCSKKGSTTSASTGGGGGGGGGGGTTNPGTLKLTVSSAWESNLTVKTVEGTCEVPTGSARTTTTACAINIPEGRLHFSRLYFTIEAGTEAQTLGCEAVFFFPYFYIANDSDPAFSPAWTNGAPVDCTASPLPSDCYSGIGTTMIPDFPNNAGVYFPLSQQAAATYEGKSANETGRVGSNRWYTNDLVVRGADIAGPNGYAGGSMQDYLVSCEDQWHDRVFGILLTLDDVDLDPGFPGGDDDYPEWL